MMVSLPGYLFTSSTKIENLHMFHQQHVSRFSLLFQWKLNHYKKFEHYVIATAPMCVTFSTAIIAKCFNISSITNKNHYIVIEMEQDVSWNEAQKVCEDAGMLFPFFVDRDQLEELLAMLKLSRDIPPIEGIFIGLKYSSSSNIQVLDLFS